MRSMTATGPFANEYIWFLRFDDKGEKITEIVEFFDSKAATDIRAQWAEAGLLESHH